MKAISFPFRFENGKVAATKSYEELVRGQIIDAVTTNYYERVMRPQYGADVQRILFDPSDSLVRFDAAAQIKDRLIRSVTRASIGSVNLTVDNNHPNVVNVEVNYSSRFVAESLVVSIPIDTSGQA